MAKNSKQLPLSEEVEGLRRRLQEAEDTLEAIRRGEVDALVVNASSRQEVYTLKSTDYTYRVLIESMSEGALTLSINGMVLYSNARFGEMVAQPLEKVIGADLRKFIVPGDRIRFDNFFKQLDKPSKIELRIKAHRNYLVVILSAHIVSFGDESPVVSCIITDLTQQKQKTALEAAEKLSALKLENERQVNKRMSIERQRLYDLLSQAPAMIAVIRGPELKFELANSLYLKVVGRAKSIIGKPLLEVFPELKGQPILDIVMGVVKTGKPFVGSEVLAKLDRYGSGKPEDVYFNFIYQPLRDEFGKVEGIMTHAIEVTDQVQTRRQLAESEAKFRMLADNIPNLAWMANADGWIYWYNRRWYEYTGTEPKDMEGWGWQNVHDPEILPSVNERWKKSIKSGQPFDMVFPLRGSDGKYRQFLTRVIPERNEKGNIIRWFGTNTDITEQKLLEHQKDEFIGIASHELKTPVTSLKAYAQIMERRFKKKHDKQSAENMSRMVAQLDKLTNLIGDLLDVTKVDAGKLELHLSNIIFDDLVREAVSQAQLTTERHKITVSGSTNKQIYSDRERIFQVFTNLLSNAVKYSPHSKSIEVKLSADEDSINACVVDYGIGVSDNKKGQIFERFYRVSGPNMESFPGIGLGLYISAEIVQRLNGKIWVESEEGKGSVFCIKLPVKPTNIKQQKNSDVVEEMAHE